MTQQPHPVDPELKLAREYGSLQGTLDGQREALSRAHALAYLEAHHAEMKTAGLCRCPDPAAAQEPLTTAAPTPDPLADLSDILTSFLSELARITGMLQPKPARVEPEYPLLAPPQLKAEVNTMLAGLAERVTVPDYLLRDAAPEPRRKCGALDLNSGIICTKPADHATRWNDEVHDHAHPFTPRPASSVGSCALCSRPRSHSNHDSTTDDPGRQVDADDTPAIPAQHTLDIEPPAAQPAPRCEYACDNEAQHPDCVVHGTF